MLVFGFGNESGNDHIVFAVMLFPVLIYFFISTFNNTLILKLFKLNNLNKIKRIISIYSFIFINLLFLTILLGIKNQSEILFLILLSPLEIFSVILAIKYFTSKVNRNNKIYTIEENIFNFNYDEAIILNKYERVEEIDKRKFFKLLAGAGLGVFVAMMLNPQKAGAAFFGSVPGPGTIGIKDTTGALIDPAIKSPTDGYGIANTDTASAPFYYGFVNKDGAWYIVKEVGDGSFLYSKGTSGYNWSNRASESYASFSSTF